MCFPLFADVDEYILKFVGLDIEKEGAEKYDISVCPEIKTLQISSKLGIENKTFYDYQELLSTIIMLGKKIYADTMVEKLDNVEYELRHNYTFLPLMTEGNEIEKLIANIRHIRENYVNYNFTLTIKLGHLDNEYMVKMLDGNPTIKYTIDDAKKHAKELCYKSDDREVRYWCDSYEPLVYAIVYTVPEEKRIIIVYEVEDVGEVYKQVMGYNTAEEYLKALENVYGMVS